MIDKFNRADLLVRRDTSGYILHQFIGVEGRIVPPYHKSHRNLARRFIRSPDDRGIRYGRVGLNDVLQFR